MKIVFINEWWKKSKAKERKGKENLNWKIFNWQNLPKRKIFILAGKYLPFKKNTANSNNIEQITLFLNKTRKNFSKINNFHLIESFLNKS